MPTILMAEEGCDIPHQELTFPSSRWPVIKMNLRQQPFWVEIGLYSWKTKLAGIKRKKKNKGESNESQVLRAEALAIGLSWI